MFGGLSFYRHSSGRYLALLVVVGLGFSLVGACTSVSQTKQTDNIQLKKALVARDLLHVMTQILPPSNTTIQLGKPNSAFGRELEKGFREIGYGLQRMEADQGPMFMSYSESSRTASNATSTTTYSVFIGEVGLERVYAEVDAGGIAPLSAMQVFGTHLPVEVSKELFPGQTLGIHYSNLKQSDTALSAITVIDEELIASIANPRRQAIPGYKALNWQNQVIENLADRGSSNFAEVNRNYRVVRKDVIVFPDESLLLLDKGREQIGKLVSFYQAGTDVFRLIGCSHGPTNHSSGNVGLALGRSKRVAKELLSRKVNQADILDEGCWAGESITDFPPRGVVVELQRSSI